MEKKKGMEFHEKDGMEKRTSVEIEKENVERKCLDSENNFSWPSSLNLAEKRKKKDLKKDELAKEQVGKLCLLRTMCLHILESSVRKKNEEGVV
jgi:hypothetical protein